MYNPRDEAISAIVRKYKSHPLVVQAIQNQKNSHSSPRGNDDIIRDFLAEAGAYALLSTEDEQELFGYIEQGYRLYEELGGLTKITPEQEEVFVRLTAAQQVAYHTNLRLAISIAKPYMGWQGNHMQAMDHIQEATIGLAIAINRFDATKGFKFSTYATNWIQQNVRRAMADKSRTIRLPVHKHEKYIDVKKKVTECANTHGRYLTHQEIETASGMTYGQYSELMRVGSQNIPSLEQALPNGDDRELGEVIGYDHMDRAIEALSNREELAAIIENTNLKDREKLVLGLRYGIEPELFGNPTVEIGGKTVTYADLFVNVQINPDANTTKGELTLEEIGEAIGVTRERVRQIQNNALAVLQVSAKNLERAKARIA